MKINVLLLLLFFTMGQYAYAQENFTEEPGKITQYEISLKEYDKDPDAEALVIYDLGEYFFRADASQNILLEMKFRKKIKILKQAGIKYANIEIPYYIDSRDWETIEKLEAITYNQEGTQLKKTLLDPKNVFEEKVSDNMRVKKIALSDVREGSIIEVAYTISTPYYKFMREWYFQDKIPVVKSRLRYRAIPYYEYAYIIKGIGKMDEFNSFVAKLDSHLGPYTYREMVYDFGLNNIPAFKDDDFVSSPKDYLASIHFQMSKVNFPEGGSTNIISTWTEICNEILKNDFFGKYIKKSQKEAEKILPQLALEDKTQAQKIEEIADYVKSNYSWDGSNNRYADSKFSDFLKQKKGNNANINLFLVGLLQKAGLDAHPVLLSTREHGAVSIDHPFAQFFNYVIAMVNVNERIYLVDATDPLLHFSSLPEQCINVLGLVTKPKQEAEWLITKQQNITQANKTFNIEVDPSTQSLKVGANYMSNGNFAHRYRSIYSGDQDNLKKSFKKNNNIDVIGDIEVINHEKLNQPFVIKFAFNTNVEAVSDKLFIHPFCNLSMDNNKFKQNSRTLPIDMIYTVGERYESLIVIPDGYEVDYIPKQTRLDNDVVTFNYNVDLIDNAIRIVSDYKLKQNIYEASQYNDLKMSFAKMIDQLGEMVVLKKK